METLIIYDNNGVIYVQQSGYFQIPDGIQHMIIELPQGKIASTVDTSVTPHQAVLVDLPKSEIELLREQLETTQQAVDFLLMGGM